MLMGSKEWWTVVQSTCALDAEQMLRDYKATLLVSKAGTPEHHNAGVQIQKVNAELHRITQVLLRASWQRAIRNVYGEDGYEKVAAERARLEVAP